MKRGIQGGITILCILGLGLLFLGWWQIFWLHKDHTYGATFSPAYAEFLGLDPHQVLEDSLEELPLTFIRLPVHWDEIQPQPKAARFRDLDWIMNEALEHDKKVVLAIGNKVPRWPECYSPDWAMQLPRSEYDQALLDYLNLVVTRYRNHPALLRWQVENETLFMFGECPESDYNLLKQEIDLVRRLDSQHPIQLTVSGEQQIWASLAGEADVIGASMYRQVALPNGMRFTFPIPARLYSLQALTVWFFTSKVVISELQAEPWLSKDYREYSLDEAARLFTPQQLTNYLRYAKSTGLQEISVWGIEWWYYLRSHGYPELWETGKNVLN